MRNRRLALAAVIPLAVVLAGAAPRAKPPQPVVPLGDPIEPSGCAGCETWPPILLDAGGAAVLGWRLLHDDNAMTLDRHLPAGADGRLATLSGSGYVVFTSFLRDGDDWLVGWEDYRANKLLLSRADGAAHGPGDGVLLNPDRPANMLEGGLRLFARDGRMLMLWSRLPSESGPSTLLARRVDDQGNTLGEAFEVGNAHARIGATACLRADGSALVAWRNVPDEPPTSGVAPSGISMRRLGPDAQPLTATTTIVPVSSAFWPGFALACANDGSYAFLWATSAAPAKSGVDVVFQRFDAKGKPRGKATLLATALAGDQIEPLLAARPDGSYLAAWTSVADGTSSIRGRRVAKNGKASGGELVLVPAVEGAEIDHPDLVALPDGTFVVGWWQNRVAMMRWFRG